LSRLSRRDDPLDERVTATRPDPAPTPEHHAELDERRRRLWRAISRLSKECRLLLRLAAFAPRVPLAVVSDALGRPPGAIGPTRKRCLGKLRQLLEAEPDGGWR
jgi:RNA polymerase sigma factor (sigma-70 family)